MINPKDTHRGFSLIELMVGLVIGLIATLVIMQVFANYEDQKRRTTGTADTQTNGAVALYSIQQDLEQAGYALPFYLTSSPLSCDPEPTYDHDGNAATAPIGIAPVQIVDGGTAPGASDTIVIHYGDSPTGGVPVKMVAGTTGTVAMVDTNFSCRNNDVALVQSGIGGACNLTKVTAVTAAGVTPATITLASSDNVATKNIVSCLGVWNERRFSISNNQLTRTGDIDTVTGLPKADAVPVVAGIVNIQAQYGVTNDEASREITQWVDAVGGWANPTVADRNRIAAVRIAVVARSGNLEKEPVSQRCSSLNTPNPTGLCAWTGTANSPAPDINITNTDDWDRYRYRVFETVIPLRNKIWNSGT